MISGDLAIRQTNLDLQLADDLPLIFGDPVQLQQVLVNLLKNAAEAVERLPRDQRRVSVLTKQDGENVVVHIRDWGQIPIHRFWIVSLNPTFQPRVTDWGWACVSANRLLNSIKARSGRR
ncbi:MAG: hypothetical protein U0892_11835 [Pirellulales bacterium]